MPTITPAPKCGDCKVRMVKYKPDYTKVCGVTYRYYKCPNCGNTIASRIK